MKNHHIDTYNQARSRLKRGRYTWSNSDHTRDSDRLTMFTVESHAREESEHNLQYLLSVGEQYGARYMAINDFKIQYVSKRDVSFLESEIVGTEWYRDRVEAEDGWRKPNTTTDENWMGRCLHFRVYRHDLLISEHHGVYDLETGKRMTNRRGIIEALWELGFAAWRGRPLTVASIKWSGTREELEELTQLAERHGSRYNRSDVAKKIWSAYNSISRYAAWPGTW